MSLRNFIRWLNGVFSCQECNKEYQMKIFGYGTTICPACHPGGKMYLMFDDSFLLNRIMKILQIKSEKLMVTTDEIVLQDYTPAVSEFEIVRDD